MESKVSVIIPAYNSAKFIKHSIESIVNQTYENIELLLIDDGSTDCTLEVMKKYEEKYEFIKVIPLEKNQGVSHARNIGIEMAAGDYLFFLDSDDLIDTSAVEDMIVAAKYHDADLVELKKLFWNKSGAYIFQFEMPELHEKFYICTVKSDGKEINTSPFMASKLYKKELIGSTRFDENIKCYEDLLFSYEVNKKVTKYIYLDKVHYHYIQRPNSLANSFSKKHFDYIKVLDEIIDEPSKPMNKKDKFIIDTIIAVAASKVSKIEAPIKERKEMVKGFVENVNNLYPDWNTEVHWTRWLVLNSLKSNLFLTFYLPIVKRVNLVKVTFDIKGISAKLNLKQRKEYKQVRWIAKIMDESVEECNNEKSENSCC